jgi:hypothetical protein
VVFEFEEKFVYRESSVFFAFTRHKANSATANLRRFGRNLGQPEKGTLLRMVLVVVKVLRLELKKIDRFWG